MEKQLDKTYWKLVKERQLCHSGHVQCEDDSSTAKQKLYYRQMKKSTVIHAPLEGWGRISSGEISNEWTWRKKTSASRQ